MSQAPAVDPSGVRSQIIQAATRLFARKGYGSTSVREVVEAAGVTKPTLYYYFANKEALFLEIVNTHIDGLGQLVRAVVDSDGTVRERLQHFATLYTHGAAENKDAVRLLMTLKHDSLDQPAVDLMSMHQQSIQQFGVLLQQGVEAGELRADIDIPISVMAFMGSLNLICAATVEGMSVPDGATERIVDIFFNGVGS